jgi:hypothetical protein
MAGANRTTGTADKPRILKHIRKTLQILIVNLPRITLYSVYSDSEDEYIAGSKDEKQDQKTNHEEKRMNSLRKHKRKLKNDDHVLMEHSRRTTETRYETNVVAYT